MVYNKSLCRPTRWPPRGPRARPFHPSAPEGGHAVRPGGDGPPPDAPVRGPRGCEVGQPPGAAAGGGCPGGVDGGGKPAGRVVGIVPRLARTHARVLATRARESVARALATR